MYFVRDLLERLYVSFTLLFSVLLLSTSSRPTALWYGVQGFSLSYSSSSYNLPQTRQTRNGQRCSSDSKSKHLFMTASNQNALMPMRQGSIVALITPMLPTGQIDIASLRSLLQFHVRSGTDGICILGTTGEASLMDRKERELILQTTVQEVKGTIPILVGTGAIDPNHVKEMILQAADLGCDASLLVTPMYIKPPQRGLVQFYHQMADLDALPIVMYNVPGRTGVDLKPETIAQCALHTNIIGVKEATGDVSRVAKIQGLVQGQDPKKKLLLYSGDDATEAEFVLKGGDGCISVTANCAPKAMHDLMMACLKGDEKEAMRINKDLDMLHQRIFCESNPIPAKWAVKRIGQIPHAYCRPPLMELDPQYYSHVEEALQQAHII